MGNKPIELLKVPQPKEDTLAKDSGGKFPMHVHSADGKHVKEVRSDVELSQAVSDGWVRVDIDPGVNIPAEETAAAPAAKKPTPKKK